MRIKQTRDRNQMGHWVASQAAKLLRQRIAEVGSANLLVATGASQFEVLGELVKQPGVDWSCVSRFHLDEYVGLDASHPASFCRYLRERFVEHVQLKSFLYLRGDRDPASVIAEASAILRERQIDVALVGVGENGHLAFNDPPADFETDDPYLLVQLDRACREQQVGEGWFASLEQVPTQAISMSVKQILKASQIFCSVPDARKAAAVSAMLSGKITPDVPASILRDQPHVVLVIDDAAASETATSVLRQWETVT